MEENDEGRIFLVPLAVDPAGDRRRGREGGREGGGGGRGGEGGWVGRRRRGRRGAAAAVGAARVDVLEGGEEASGFFHHCFKRRSLPPSLPPSLPSFLPLLLLFILGKSQSLCPSNQAAVVLEKGLEGGREGGREGGSDR